jgi:catechol 2,3-dioxygenase-like lactoylglutathione lyase family enzyme
VQIDEATWCYPEIVKKRPIIPRLNGGPQTILLVEDVPRTMAFYRDILRLEVMDGDPERYVEFDLGDGGLLLLVKREGSIAPMAMERVKDETSTLTFSIATEGYEHWKTWFGKKQIEIEREAKWIHGGRSLYVRDPDGRRLELKTPPVVAPPKPKAEPPKEKEKS